MKTLFVLGSFLLSAAAARAAPDYLPASYRQQIHPVEKPLALRFEFGPGQHAELRVVNYPNGRSDLFFVHMHMDELAAKAAGESQVKTNGGTFMYLVHGTGIREMKIKLTNPVPYELDPNRIFTAFGLETKTRPVPKGKDLETLRAFAAWFKKNIELGRAQRSRPMVTALHNNTDDDKLGKALSIHTEKELLGVDNRDVHQNPMWDIDNFYIATLPSTYRTLVERFDPNISLRMEKPRDIGYLSNWMIQTGVEYLNVETQRDDLHVNLRMVQAVQDLFR